MSQEDLSGFLERHNEMRAFETSFHESRKVEVARSNERFERRVKKDMAEENARLHALRVQHMQANRTLKPAPVVNNVAHYERTWTGFRCSCGLPVGWKKGFEESICKCGVSHVRTLRRRPTEPKPEIFCACGCGKPTKGGGKWIVGHHLRVHPSTYGYRRA